MHPHIHICKFLFLVRVSLSLTYHFPEVAIFYHIKLVSYFSFVFYLRLHPGINNLSISHLNPHHNLINTMSSKQTINTPKAQTQTPKPASTSTSSTTRIIPTKEEEAAFKDSSRNVHSEMTPTANRAVKKLRAANKPKANESQSS